MMKRNWAIVVCLMMISTSSFGSHGPAGCGLGQMLFDGKEGLVFNVLAATFNGSSGNQTFGMSTGTLGCEDAQTAKVSAVGFVEANRFALANDVARGSGETLEAYLILTSKENADRTKLQSSYDQIFAENTTANDIHAKLQSLL